MSASQIKEPYRPEIDGLRAISVIGVVFFHAGFHFFSGGFVGVDIFFVISGYLITKKIIGRMETKTFSLSDFYFERIRRILPALTFVIFLSAVLAWIILMPIDLEDFASSLKSVATISSNLYFSENSGYFTPAADLKPLLHTWSLAVEEQFYLIFPIYLLLIQRLKKALLLPTTVLIATLSLAYGQYLSSAGNISSFFLLTTRCWEILIGACVALYPETSNRAQNIKPLTRSIIEFLAILLIIGSILVFRKYDPLPGLLSLIPTIGACLIIIYTNPKTFLGRALSNKGLVTIGLISYSAYLFHIPVFAFFRLAMHGEFHSYAYILILFTFILAYFSWRFIEIPFRRINQKNVIYSFGILSTGCMLLLGYFLKSQSFNLNRFAKEKRPVIHAATIHVREGVKRLDQGGCFIGFHQSYTDLINQKCISKYDKSIILFGDSYAAHHLEGIKEVFKNTDYKVQQWTATACRAIDVPNNSKRCRDFNKSFTDEIALKLTSKSSILISSHWLNTYNKFGEKHFTDSLELLLNKLKDSQATIIFIGQTPTFPMDPFLYLLRERRYNNSEELMKIRKNHHVNEILEQYAHKYGARFINPSNPICKNSGSEPPECYIKMKNVYLFFDSGHLTDKGSLIIWGELKELLIN